MRPSVFLFDSILTSLAYESAVSEERFPAPLSWDVKLLQGALWSDGIPNLLHLLLPQCPVPVDKKPVPADACPFGHHHLFPDAKALQNVLEKINFSALILRSFGPMRILPHIYYLYRWLASAVSVLTFFGVQYYLLTFPTETGGTS